MRGNQLSRYGAMAGAFPLTTGKVFFLVNATEAAAGDFLSNYPGDDDGAARAFTTWAAVITACQASTDADVVVVSPLFTTAPTQAELASLNAAGAVTVQAGSNLPDGSYLVTKAAASMANTTLNVFQVNGRIELLDLIAEVVTSIAVTATSGAKFRHVPTVGTTIDVCATTDISGRVVGDQFSITGTLATALLVSSVATTGGVIVRQAAPLYVTAGTINFSKIATTNGNVKFTARYKPIDAGAFVSAL